MHKSGQQNFRNVNEFWGTVCFSPFILLNAMSGKVLDFCVLLKFDKSEFVIWFYSCWGINITRDGLARQM